MEVKFCQINNSKDTRRIPLRDKTAGYDPETREVFLSAIPFGGKMRNYVCMGFDSIPMIFQGRNLYCPASWLRAEFPALAADIDLIVLKVRAFFEDGEG